MAGTDAFFFSNPCGSAPWASDCLIVSCWDNAYQTVSTSRKLHPHLLSNPRTGGLGCSHAHMDTCIQTQPHCTDVLSEHSAACHSVWGAHTFGCMAACPMQMLPHVITAPCVPMLATITMAIAAPGHTAAVPRMLTCIHQSRVHIDSR